MSQHRPPIAVFDLDGTLADTIHDLIATLNFVLDREGLPHLSLDEGKRMVGAGSRALIERGFAAVGREVGQAHLDDLHRAFLAHYSENICVQTKLFPGTLEALDRLEDSGFRLAVCTNKFETHSIAVLAGLGIAHRFAAICGRDNLPRKCVRTSCPYVSIAFRTAALPSSVMVASTPRPSSGLAPRRTRPCNSNRRICRVTRLGSDISSSAKITSPS